MFEKSTFILKAIQFTIFFFTLSIISTSGSFAQSKIFDFIVVEEKVTPGSLENMPSESNTVIFFTPNDNSKKQKYTVLQVSEFRFNGRMFFRKNLGTAAKPQYKFLERVSAESQRFPLFRLHDESGYFYIGKDDSLFPLKEDYKEKLKEVLENPNVDPLVDLTDLKEDQLNDLLQNAWILTKPRTFTKPIVFTPYVGFGFIDHLINYPDINHSLVIRPKAIMVGINTEYFINYHRNISLNFSPQLIQYQSLTFDTFQAFGNRYESDVFVRFSSIQLPVSIRYYLDISPNKLRLYGDLGAVASFGLAQQATIYEAIIEKDEIQSSKSDFEFPNNHFGITYGFGMERYFKKHKGLVLGMKGLHISGKSDSKITQNQLFLGYKF